MYVGFVVYFLLSKNESNQFYEIVNTDVRNTADKRRSVSGGPTGQNVEQKKEHTLS